MDDVSSEFDDNENSKVSDSGSLSLEVDIPENGNNDMDGDLEHGDEYPDNNYSSNSSSPFISNPDLIQKIESSPTPRSLQNDEANISLKVEEMDNSLLNLKESFASFKLGNRDQLELSFSQNESTHNSTMDTTRYNQTQAQFDRDLELDNCIRDTKRTSPSPWKKLRSSSTNTLSHIGGIPKLQFNQPNYFNNDELKQSFSTCDNSTVFKINELNKQVTGYRIQIKLFKQFLQRLIDKTQHNGSVNMFDMSELSHIQNNLEGLSPLKSTEPYGITQNRNMEHDELSQNYDELLKLNEDLYENLEDFQNQLQEKEIQLHESNNYLDNCSRIINEVLELLINDPTTENNSRQALMKCIANESDGPGKPLDTKLHVVRFELSKKLESRDMKASNQRYPSPPPSHPEKEHTEVANYINIIQELVVSLDELQKEFTSHKEETVKIQYNIKKEAEATEKAKSNYESLFLKFNQLCETLEKKNTGDYNEDVEKLRDENQKLRLIHNTVDNKFSEYQAVIDKLQQEVNEFNKGHQNSNRSFRDDVEWLSSTNNNIHHEDLLQSHKDINQLHENLNNLTQQYRKLQDDTSKTISALTDQLHNKQQENLSLNADQRVAEQLKNDLNISVERQRILKAEKIRLSYEVDSLSNDKVSLQSTIRSLTDKITSLTIEAPQFKKEETNQATVKELNTLEYQVRELLLRDVHVLQKFMKSFMKIADDSSLKEPKRKIERLLRTTAKEVDQKEDGKQSRWNISELDTVREYHKSVFDYFARAVDIIVNDHVKLLLKESEHSSQTADYVTKLHKRIDEMNALNDTLTKQVDFLSLNDDYSDTTQNSTMSTSGSKLRMEELTNRWKAEREARVYENQEAQKRLNELEVENALLRKELEQTT